MEKAFDLKFSRMFLYHKISSSYLKLKRSKKINNQNKTMENIIQTHVNSFRNWLIAIIEILASTLLKVIYKKSNQEGFLWQSNIIKIAEVLWRYFEKKILVIEWKGIGTTMQFYSFSIRFNNEWHTSSIIQGI